MLKQINHNFKNYYYLTEEGQVFNILTEQYLKPYKEFYYKLVGADGKNKTVAIKKLMKLVYDIDFIQDNIERLDGEEFVFIPNTENKYLISNKGRVISYQSSKARLLSPTINAGGYQRIEIKINGKFQNKLVHCLVAESFCEKPKDATKLECHHKDFNKLNNSSSNLEYLKPEDHRQKHLEHLQETQKII